MLKEWLIQLALLLQPVVIEDAKINDLSQKTVWIEEPTSMREMTPEQAMERFAKGEFKGPSPKGVNLGITGRSTWLLIPVTNASETERYIWWLSFTGIDFIDTWLIDSDGNMQALPGIGDHRSSDNKGLPNRLPNLIMEIPKGKTHYILYWAQNNSSLQADTLIAKDDLFLGRALSEDMLLFTIYSMLIAICIFHSFLFIRTKNRLDLIYAVFNFLSLSFYFTMLGHTAQYLLPDQYIDSLPYIGLLAPATLIVLAEFTIAFLALKKFSKMSYRLVRGLQLVTFIVPISLFVGSEVAFIKIWSVNSLIAPFLVFGVACYMWRKGQKALGILPYHPLYHFALHIGAAIELVVLALAIGDRLRVLQNQAIEAQRHHREAQEAHTQEILRWNQGLEQKIEEQSRDITLLLTHAKIGLLSITEKLLIHKDYSKFLEDILEEKQLAEQNVEPILINSLHMNIDARARLMTALNFSFHSVDIVFAANQECFPREVSIQVKDKTKFLDLDWSAIISSDQLIERVLVSLRDITEHKLLRQKTDESRRALKVSGEILTSGIKSWQNFYKQFDELKLELSPIIQSALRNQKLSAEISRHIFGLLHTIKGLSRFYRYGEITDWIHKTESLVAAKTELSRQAIQDLADSYDGMVSLGEYYNKIAEPIINFSADDGQVVAEEDTVRSVLDEALKLADQLARELGKTACTYKIEFDAIDASPEFVRALSQALVHLIRNSIDHGLEKPDVRKAKGKPSHGHIRAYLDNLGNLCICDDGQGLNLRAIRSKAESQGLTIPTNPKDIAHLIFEAGFSTKAEVDDISGRGIGMDAVKTFLEQAGSGIEIVPESTEGDYLRFHFAIRIPKERVIRQAAY